MRILSFPIWPALHYHQHRFVRLPDSDYFRYRKYHPSGSKKIVLFTSAACYLLGFSISHAHAHAQSGLGRHAIAVRCVKHGMRSDNIIRVQDPIGISTTTSGTASLSDVPPRSAELMVPPTTPTVDQCDAMESDKSDSRWWRCSTVIPGNDCDSRTRCCRRTRLQCTGARTPV